MISAPLAAAFRTMFSAMRVFVTLNLDIENWRTATEVILF
jgi:hypothetical protein